MTFKEAEHLDFNPLAIACVMWWDGLMWWLRECQIAHDKIHQGDRGNE